ncbi:MAG: putative baseplate assembly protein [Chloroflexi bacterium]|nr:MAG: putative baseplate assembly protein [Chloroflexota bacterium]
MALPIPNLDDRRFQDLVNESKRMVQQKVPRWTDHNVHDPGVTLIELFAWMTEQVIFRLNRIPDRNYVKFLELIGVRLFPPTAARAPITFWLSGTLAETVRIPLGTTVSTRRTETDDSINFTTAEPLDIVPCSLQDVATIANGTSASPVWRRDALERGEGFTCFSRVPVPGDALLVGLGDAVPGCAVSLRLSCRIEGVGVDPNNPPLVWEAWSGDGWTACELQSDGTGGLNRDGDIVLHVPRSHAVSVIEAQRAGWLRARVTESAADQPAYGASPMVRSLTAVTIGGTVDAVNAELVDAEVIGSSEGVAGQRFQLKRQPVVPSETPFVVEVSSADGWQEWSLVSHFSSSSPDDNHFVFDPVSGEIQLGPAVREPEGSLVSYGATPAKGTQLRVRSYATGGGRRGNVARGTITTLKSSIPFVATVENRRAAAGGVDGEDIENAKLRGPILLRTLGRAVTKEDYEFLAREAAPEIARVHCVAAGEGAEAGSIRVLVVPAAAAGAGRLRFEQLKPADETLAKIGRRLDECRVIGVRVVVEPPRYNGLTIVARIRAQSKVSPVRLQEAVLDALYAYFHPISGGNQGTGWPFGRPVNLGEVYAVVQAVKGVELIQDLRLFGADPITGQRGQPVQAMPLDAHSLLFSYDHQVLVEGA